MRNSIGLPSRSWDKRRPVIRSRQRHSFMRPTFGSWTSSISRRWDSRRHFFAAAAVAMRRILVESARRKARQKRGGRLRRVDLVDQAAADQDDNLLALDEALNRLTFEDAVAARVVELRQFAGLGHEEIAATLGITVYLARQKWTYARAWLRDALGG